MDFMESIALRLFDLICQSLSLDTTSEINSHCDTFAKQHYFHTNSLDKYEDASSSIFDAFYYYNSPQVEQYRNCAGDIFDFPM